jgi:PAS domain-containing protein
MFDIIMWKEVAGIIGGLLTLIGGGIFTYYKFIVQKRTDERNFQVSQIKDFYTVLMGEHNNLRAEYNLQKTELILLSSKIEQLEKELSFFRANVLAVQSKEMLKSIMEARSNPCYIFDIGTNYWYLNDAFCKRFKIERRDFWSPINLIATYTDIEKTAKLLEYIEVINIGTPVTKEILYPSNLLYPKTSTLIRAVVKRTPIKIKENSYIFEEVLEILEENIPN